MSEAKIGWATRYGTNERKSGMLLPSGNFVFFDAVAPWASTWSDHENFFFEEAFDPKSDPMKIFVLDVIGHIWVYGPSIDVDYDGWIDLYQENYGCSDIQGITGGHVLEKKIPGYWNTLIAREDEEPLPFLYLRETSKYDVYHWEHSRQQWHNKTRNTYHTWKQVTRLGHVFEMYLEDPDE